MSGALRRWFPVLAYAVVMTWLSSQPGPALPKWKILSYDKLLHIIEYAGFGFLVYRALGAWLKRAKARLAVAVVIGLVFGVVDEFHQSFVFGRTGNDPGDMIADLIGTSIGAFAFERGKARFGDRLETHG